FPTRRSSDLNRLVSIPLHLFAKSNRSFCGWNRSFVRSLCACFRHKIRFVCHHVYLLKQKNIFVDNKEVLFVHYVSISGTAIALYAITFICKSKRTFL